MMKLIKYIVLIFIGIVSTSSCDRAKTDVNPTIIELKDDNYSVKQNSKVLMRIDSNDIIIGNDITITIFNPEKGTITLKENEIAFLYEPNKNSVGKEILTYTVCVGSKCEVADINITIEDSSNPNPLPDSCQYSIIALNDVISNNVDTFIIYKIDLIENDFTCGSIIELESFRFKTEPSSGKLFYLGNYGVAYVPNPNFIEDEFEYEICNANGDCDRARVKLLNSDYTSPTLE